MGHWDIQNCSALASINWPFFFFLNSVVNQDLIEKFIGVLC